MEEGTITSISPLPAYNHYQLVSIFFLFQNAITSFLFEGECGEGFGSFVLVYILLLLICKLYTIYPGSDHHGVLSNPYFYGGLLLLMTVFTIITYAIYFLRKNYQATKSSESMQGIASTRYSFSLRPPPPSLPPPKAPASPYEQQHLISSCPPPCDHYILHSNTCYPQLTATPDKKLQK